MPIGVREQEIQRLVRFYRKSIRDLAKDFVTAVDFEKPRFISQMQSSFRILNELDAKTERWAKRNIADLYNASAKESEVFLKKLGVASKDLSRAKAFSQVNHQAIQALLVDPEVGFLTATKGAIQQIKQRMKLVQNQAKVLATNQRVFAETIARVGFLEGASLQKVKAKLIEEMVSLKKSSEMVWTARAAALPTSEIVSNVANLPFVKIPAKNAASGFRRLRIDHYAEMLARTKSNQAANLARRNRALQHSIPLMQISKNKPLQDDACFLYIGKVYALTQAAAAEYKIPMVNELPNGGCPFHPNCTHQELIFVPDYATEAELSLAFGLTPAWALNRPWLDVEKEYQKRGGPAILAKLNQAAEKMGHTTGGRERRRKEAGLPPDDFPPGEPPVEPPPPPPAPEKLPVAPPSPPPPALDFGGPGPTFQLPMSMDSLKVNGPWRAALRDPVIGGDLEKIISEMVGDLGKALGATVSAARNGLGTFGGSATRQLIITVKGTVKQAREIAAAAGWTIGQESTYGFKLLQPGTKLAEVAKNKGVILRFKRPLQETELSKLAAQKEVKTLVPIGDRDFFAPLANPKDDIIVYKRGLIDAVERSLREGADGSLVSASTVSVSDFYTEQLVQTLKRNRKLHDAIRKARRAIHERIARAVHANELPFEIEFLDGFKLADILEPRTMARELIAQGITSQAEVQAVGKLIRKEVMRGYEKHQAEIQRVTRKKEQIGDQKHQLGERLNQIEKENNLGPYAIGVEQDPMQALHEIEELGKKPPRHLLEWKATLDAVMELDGEISRLSDELIRLNNLRGEAFRKEFISVLSSIRELGGVAPSLAFGSNGEIGAALRNASKIFPKTWNEASENYPSLIRATWTKKSDIGGSYAHGVFGTYSEMKIHESMNLGTNAGKSMVAHEYMHRMEKVVKELGKLEAEFYMMRTTRIIKGTVVQEPLRRMGVAKGFPKGTKIRDDRFGDGKTPASSSASTRYMGRDYGRQDSWEIMTKGIEGLLGYDQDVFLKLLDDSELLDFILGALASL